MTRRNATREGIWMLSVTGAAILTVAVVIGALAPEGMSTPPPASFGMQWMLTLAGMCGLLAIAAGVAALRERVRDEFDAALKYALAAVGAATPAVAMHITFQAHRVSATPHHRWFAMVVATGGAIEIGVLLAAIIVIAHAYVQLTTTPIVKVTGSKLPSNVMPMS